MLMRLPAMPRLLAMPRLPVMSTLPALLKYIKDSEKVLTFYPFPLGSRGVRSVRGQISTFRTIRKRCSCSPQQAATSCATSSSLSVSHLMLILLLEYAFFIHLAAFSHLFTIRRILRVGFLLTTRTVPEFLACVRIVPESNVICSYSPARYL